MTSVISFCALFLIFSYDKVNAQFVKNVDFDDLKRIVNFLQKSFNDEKAKNEILQLQFLRMQKTCNKLNFQLLETKSRLQKVEKLIKPHESFGQNEGIGVKVNSSRGKTVYNSSNFTSSSSFTDGKNLHINSVNGRNGTKQRKKLLKRQRITTEIFKALHSRETICKDVKDDCFYYDNDKCVDAYAPWAKENCAFRCGYCSEKPLCVNKINYCSSLNKDDCTNPNYLGYMRTNCRLYCDLCDLPNITATVSQSNATPGSLAAGEIPHRVGDCYDKLLNDQCFNYNDNNCYGIYAPWAIENCRLRCGFCENMQPPCVDQIPNCNLYSKSDCVTYDKWGRYTCRKFCDRCTPPTQNVHFTTPTSIMAPTKETGKDLTSNHVAFTVNGVKDRKNLGPHQTIVFKSILTNVGHSFNQQTGIFTCTIPGVYVFYCSIVVNADADIKVSIVKDGVDTTFAYQPVGKNQGGTMSVIHLNAGESVWVRMAQGDFIGNTFEDVENSFSGFLLYPDV